jgi:hypothetical protein
MITQELIDLISRKEVQDKWNPHAGDRVYRKYTIFGDELDSKIWSDEQRVEIIIIRQPSSVKSFWHCTNEKGEERLLTDEEMQKTTCLWLPLPIDPINPERGVIDWIDKEYWLITFLHDGQMQATQRHFNYRTYQGNPLTVLLEVFIRQQDNK